MPPFLSDPALRAVLAALPRARIVGGAVRDALAGKPVADIDLATPDPPEDVIAALKAAGLKHAPTGLAHGTVTAIAGHRGFEVTTLRRDMETDGRHATVAFTGDWREDAARRDFTINAMSMAPDGTLHDYFNGAADLAAGRVRFVGDPATRIAEDYLRILRFFRFHARYGKGAPEPEALRAIAAATNGLTQLSAERVWSELKRILAGPRAAEAAALMAETGVLPAILPEGAQPARLAALEAGGAPPDPILRLAALMDGDAAALAARLRLSGAERDRLTALRHGPAPNDTDDDATLRRLLADETHEVLTGRAWLTGATTVQDRLAKMERPVFPFRGRDLAALGMQDGPDMGRMLARLRGWWLQGGCTADTEACKKKIEEELAKWPRSR